MSKISVAVFAALLAVMPAVMAVSFNQTITPQDQATFDQILTPVMKIYNFVKYAATVLGVLFLVFAGVSFITSGGDQAKREQAKKMAGYVLIGLGVIWVAPFVIQYLVS